MLLTTYKPGKETDLTFTPEFLQTLPCGLHRCPMDKAEKHLPEMQPLIESAPIPQSEWNQWEVDIKIHMLMKGQYPCIPNWHCDNVPRNTDGKLEYGRIDFAEPAMLIWISGSPETTFLDRDIETPIPPRNHRASHPFHEAISG